VPMRRVHEQTTVKGKVRRAARIAGGLARSSSRPRYVAEARRRLHLTTSGKPTKNGERCLVCGSSKLKQKTIKYAKDGTVCEVLICGRCGHVGNPGNVHDYRNFKKLEKLPFRARVGTETYKGREFHIAKMATEIMGRSDLTVLVYGAGRSFDNQHIGALKQVKDVAVADVMKLRDDAEFIDINEPATKQFSLVIASEVLEHFLDPSEELPKLLDYVEKGGLLVCSTNIYDGSDLEKHKYIFIPGHTSYYTPEALIYLAQSNGYHIDFRVPLVATGYGGPRKRYVFITKDAAMLADIACYFGKHMYAPSERPWANKELAKSQKEEKERAQREQAAQEQASPLEPQPQAVAAD
jgi:Methyltransferase domain